MNSGKKTTRLSGSVRLPISMLYNDQDGSSVTAISRIPQNSRTPPNIRPAFMKDILPTMIAPVMGKGSRARGVGKREHLLLITLESRPWLK
jgi:hypothetical protein